MSLALPGSKGCISSLGHYWVLFGYTVTVNPQF
jgi:hypothetical protein